VNRPASTVPRQPAPSVVSASTGSPEETRRLAAAVASVCRPGDVLLLSGDLGAGKTVFAQGFARGLGVTEPVTSPTFILVRPYPVPGRGEVRRLVHVDLYRLDSLHEVEDLGIEELLDQGAVALIEWGEAAGSALATDALTVRLAPVDAVGSDDDGESRTVSLAGSGRSWEERRSALAEKVAPWGRRG
jgi:tRNA threonylcarbamoyladenosine biosynthesis protein TsaE